MMGVRFRVHSDCLPMPEVARCLAEDWLFPGGILAATPPDEMDLFAARCQEIQQPYWEMGQVIEGEPGVEVT
jgi:hypothetical protein